MDQGIFIAPGSVIVAGRIDKSCCDSKHPEPILQKCGAHVVRSFCSQSDFRLPPLAPFFQPNQIASPWFVRASTCSCMDAKQISSLYVYDTTGSADSSSCSKSCSLKAVLFKKCEVRSEI